MARGAAATSPTLPRQWLRGLAIGSESIVLVAHVGTHAGRLELIRVGEAGIQFHLSVLQVCGLPNPCPRLVLLLISLATLNFIILIVIVVMGGRGGGFVSSVVRS